MSVVEAAFADSGQLGVPTHIIESPWVVLKFGGSSVASFGNWQSIAQIIRNRLDAGLHVLVVHSALAGVSDLLSKLLEETESGGGEDSFAAIVAIHKALAAEMDLDPDEMLGELFVELEQLAAGSRLVKEVSPRVHARIMALGELMATRLSGSWLQSQDMDAQWLDARSLLESKRARHSNERQSYLNAVCDPADSEALRSQLRAQGQLVLTQGFIAANQEKETVLLGRGGSDTSAAYFASMLGARRLEIWSDVPGVFSADPRLVPGARLLKNLHYDEAQEIASTGGSVLHPRSIAPMRRRSIPVFLRCTGSPELSGTVISPATPDEVPQVKAVSVQKGITLLSLEGIAMWQEAGFLADVFQTFARHGVSVDLVSTSESNVTVSIEENLGQISAVAMELLVAELSELCRVRVLRQCSAVSLVGRRIRAILHKIGPALQVFEEERVYLVCQAANDLNLSFVCDEDNSFRIVERLHALLFKSARNHPGFGLSWEEFTSDKSDAAPVGSAWWRNTQNDLLEAFADRHSAFVYNLNEVEAAANRLLSMKSVANVFFAMKANPNPEIL
ncbi:MAG: aspartate kinase, partial [Pseudomonadota bacterium]